MASIYYLNACGENFINWLEGNWEKLNGENRLHLTEYLHKYWLEFINPDKHIKISELMGNKKYDDIAHLRTGFSELDLDSNSIDVKDLRHLIDSKKNDLVKVFIKNFSYFSDQLSDEMLAFIQSLLEEKLITFDDLNQGLQGSLIEYSAQKSLATQNSIPVLIQSIHTFLDISEWDKELDQAAVVFQRQNGFWPNIFQANDITYRKIELVANAKPNKIKGDAKDGMPTVPSHFVELSGFQGEHYSLEMCIDDTLAEYEFRLIYDSDPDGEFYVEPEDLEKAV